MKYYKVVLQSGIKTGMMSSCVASRPQCRTIYQLNKWAYPKIEGSKLFVFDSLIAAEELYITIAHKCSSFQIYECEIINPTKSAPFCGYYSNGQDIERMSKMWKLWKQKKKYTHLVDGEPPKGTVWVDAVKLTKLISNYKINF